MSGPSSDVPPGAPGRGPGGADRVNLARALVVIVVGLVAGVLLLDVASRPTTVPSGTAATSSTTTTTHPVSTTTTTTMPPANVTVQVANGSSATGIAAAYTTELQSAGWKTLTPIDTTTNVASSSVYYAAGQQKSAEAVAHELGLAKSAVQPLTSSVPVSATTGVDVLVVAGPDLAARAPTTTTTAAG